MQLQIEAKGHAVGPASAEGGDGAGDEVGVAGPGGRREGAGDREAVLPGATRDDLVADAGEDDQAFELVVAIGAAAGDVQGKVDLGGSRLDQRQRSGISRQRPARPERVRRERNPR